MPKKTITKKQMATYHRRLRDRRERLISSLSNLSNQGRAAEKKGDSSDLAASSRDVELNFILSDHQRGELKAIDEALHRIEEGTYAYCIDCEVAIEPKRLEAQPFARLCLECQSEREKRDQHTGLLSRRERSTNLFSTELSLATAEEGDSEREGLEDIEEEIEEIREDMEDLDFSGKGVDHLEEEDEENLG